MGPEQGLEQGPEQRSDQGSGPERYSADASQPAAVSEAVAQDAPSERTDLLKVPTSASRRVRARIARRITAQRGALSPVLEPLVAVHRQYYPKANLALLQRAYEVAE